MSKNRKAKAGVINLEDYRWKEWERKQWALTQDEDLAFRRSLIGPSKNPWQRALSAIEMRLLLSDKAILQPMKDGIDRDDWQNWLDQIKSGQSPVPPETDDAKLKRWSAAVMKMIPAKGKNPKAIDKKTNRKSTTTLPRDLAWLDEFDEGEWGSMAAFALGKKVSPPAMRDALRRARKHRQKSSRKSSRRK